VRIGLWKGLGKASSNLFVVTRFIGSHGGKPHECGHYERIGRSFTGLRFAVVLASLPLCFTCVSAGAEPFVWLPAQAVNGVSEDLELAARARKLLLQSELLAGQTVGVRVRNRVATLWGTVSSASAALGAEECLNTLPGLTVIHSELSIDVSAGPQTDRYTVRGSQSGASGAQPQSPEARPVQGALVHRKEETPSHEFTWRPAGRKRSGMVPLPTMERLTETGATPDKPAAAALPGFPAQDSTWSPTETAARKVPQFRSKGEELGPAMPVVVLPAAPAAASSLAQAVEALRLADDRFRLVRAEVQGDTVYLRGTVYRWDHLFELARSISHLPGVRRVLFEGVRECSP
jgi:hypothetical protein